MSLHIEDNIEVTRFIGTLYVVTLLLVDWQLGFVGFYANFPFSVKY